MKTYKKRMLIVDQMACKEGGIKTFLEGFFPLLDQNDVVVDYINLFNDKKTVDRFKRDYDCIGQWVDVKDDEAMLQKERGWFEKNMAFFSSLIHNPMVEYMTLKKIFLMLNTNIYDFVMINHGESITPVTGFFPISQMVRTFAYTHDTNVFTPMKPFKGRAEECQTNYAMDSLAFDENVDIISQKDSGYTRDNFPDNKYIKIGMPLDVAKYHKYQNPYYSKEDAVLYLGRFHQEAKDPERWVNVMSKTGLRGIVIVPNKKNADSFQKLCDKYDFKDVEIHHDLTFDVKMQMSARCKVCYIPSKTENFPFVIYENLNLMRVVGPEERPWAHDFKQEFDHFILDGGIDKAPETLKEAVRTYSNEVIKEQHKFLLDYNEQIKKDWTEYLNQPSIHVDSKKGQPQIIKALNEVNNLPDAIKSIGRETLSFTELMTLYRNIENEKVFHLKNQSFYGKINEMKQQTGGLSQWM